MSPKYQLVLVLFLAINGGFLFAAGLLFFGEGFAWALYVGALLIAVAIALAVHWGFWPNEINM